ncbi:MAG: hypothetical protein HDR43_02105 [Mycoplasma sp.]|nr:hypothetical protein [Mycoplasma sp.]
MSLKKITGIVLKIFEKDDSSATIKVLGKDGIIFLLVKGYFKKESKNKSNIFLGSISEFEYFENYGKNNYFLLKKATIINFFNYTDPVYKNILEDLYNILQQVESPNKNFYNTFQKYLQEEDYYYKNFLLTYLLNLTLKTKGRGLNNCICSICSRSNDLYCIDLYEGGMLCYQHRTTNDVITNIEYLKAFYYLGKSFDEYKLNSNEETNNYLLNMLKEFNLN